jgi:hypothetical protein
MPLSPPPPPPPCRLCVSCRLSSVVSAGWQLHDRRLKLSGELADGLSPVLTHMRVVKEAQAHMDNLTAR